MVDAQLALELGNELRAAGTRNVRETRRLPITVRLAIRHSCTCGPYIGHPAIRGRG
jgi:hypothetical protein